MSTTTKIPILQGSRWIADGPDYDDHATCGALLGWCKSKSREHHALGFVEIHTDPRAAVAFNLARQAIDCARVWDAGSVRDAVGATLAMLDGAGE